MDRMYMLSMIKYYTDKANLQSLKKAKVYLDKIIREMEKEG